MKNIQNYEEFISEGKRKDYKLKDGTSQFDGEMIERVKKEDENPPYNMKNLTVNFKKHETFDFVDKKNIKKAKYYVVSGLVGEVGTKRIEICVIQVPSKRGFNWKEKDTVELWNADKRGSIIMYLGTVKGEYDYSDIGSSNIPYDKPMPVYNLI